MRGQEAAQPPFGRAAAIAGSASDAWLLLLLLRRRVGQPKKVQLVGCVAFFDSAPYPVLCCLGTLALTLHTDDVVHRCSVQGCRLMQRHGLLVHGNLSRLRSGGPGLRCCERSRTRARHTATLRALRVTVRAVARVFVGIGEGRRVVDFFCAAGADGDLHSAMAAGARVTSGSTPATAVRSDAALGTFVLCNSSNLPPMLIEW